MPTALENAVDALSDPHVSVADALRRLLVVSHRIGAADLTRWLMGELNGFSAEEEVPIYRAASHLPIKLTFAGPMNSRETVTLNQSELPRQLTASLHALAFREPVAELEALSGGDGEPQYGLGVQWIMLYRHFAADNKVPRMEMMVPNEANVLMPKTHLKGILDRVKSTALDLALSLEDVSAEVGSPRGPTVASDAALADRVTIYLTQIYTGDNATVAAGEGAIAVRVEAGDVEGLLRAAGLLVDDEAVSALADALRADGDTPAVATSSFLDKVKAGSYGLIGGLTSNGAYDGLTRLLEQAFPGTFPR